MSGARQADIETVGGVLARSNAAVSGGGHAVPAERFNHERTLDSPVLFAERFVSKGGLA